MEAEREELEKTIYNNPPTGFTDLQVLTDHLAALTETIDQATDRWLELAERAE